MTDFLLTYTLHSTVLLGLTLLLVKLPGLRRAGSRDLLLRGALVMSVLTPLIAPTLAFTSSRVVIDAAPTQTVATVPGGEGSSQKASPGAVASEDPTTLNPQPEPAPLAPLTLVFHLLLALGVLTATARFGRAWWTLRRLLQRGRPAPDFALKYGSSRHPLGLDVVMADLAVPVACGRRTILVPKTLTARLTAPQVRAVLAHEVAHLRRADPLWTAALSLLCHLFFFQPLNFLVLREWRRACEELCDAEAVGEMLEPLTLARSLLELARHPTHVPLAPLVNSAAESHLSQRIKALLEPKEMHMKRSHLFAVVFALFAVTFALPTLTLAQNAPRFFQKAEADSSTMEERTKNFMLESTTFEEFSASELVQKVPYEVLVPSDWPGTYTQPLNFGYIQPHNIVVTIYDVTQPEGENIEFGFAQQPEDDVRFPMLVGASAQIETVSVGETTGEWVEGGWSGLDSSLTWEDSGESALVWQQDGFVFMVQAFDTVELDTLLKIANSLQPLENQ